MNNTVDIKELNDKIQRESSFIDIVNMEMNNVTAKKHLDRLLEQAKKYAMEEAALPEHEGQFDGAWKNEKTV